MLTELFEFWVMLHAFYSSADFFQNYCFQILIPSKCQTVWIQIRPDNFVLSFRLISSEYSFSTYTIVMLNIFVYYTPPANLQHSSCKHVFSEWKTVWMLFRPNKKIPVFRVTLPYLNLLVKPRIFFKFSRKIYNFMHCLSKCIKLYFFQKKIIIRKIYVCVPYLVTRNTLISLFGL